MHPHLQIIYYRYLIENDSYTNLNWLYLIHFIENVVCSLFQSFYVLFICVNKCIFHDEIMHNFLYLNVLKLRLVWNIKWTSLLYHYHVTDACWSNKVPYFDFLLTESFITCKLKHTWNTCLVTLPQNIVDGLWWDISVQNNQRAGS